MGTVSTEVLDMATAVPPPSSSLVDGFPPRYNCQVEYQSWETAWTPDWKNWCCKYEGRGCPPTSTRTATQTKTKTVTTTTMASTKTTTATVANVTTKTDITQGCDTSCPLQNYNATCRDRILWAAKHYTAQQQEPCVSAFSLVLEQCPTCAYCFPQDVGCEPETEFFRRR